jgi:hypothetical protein
MSKTENISKFQTINLYEPQQTTYKYKVNYSGSIAMDMQDDYFEILMNNIEDITQKASAAL